MSAQIAGKLWWVASTSLGVLIGSIVGMSVNPIAQSVTGSLMAIVLALPAVASPRKHRHRGAEAHEEDAHAIKEMPAPMSLFALCAIPGLLGGIYVRRRTLVEGS